VEVVEAHRTNFMIEEKHPGGRPRKYQSVEQLQTAIDSYFESTEKVTVTGLTLHLGFNSRQDLINYEGYSEEFHDAIKRAKLRVEVYYEERLVGSHAAGPIFALKNFGWSDKLQTFIEVVQPEDKRITIDEMKARIKMIEDAGDGICRE
jgi:hypothetical protein